MKIYMERTLDAMIAEDPKILEALQAKVAQLEAKKINKEHYFIHKETEAV